MTSVVIYSKPNCCLCEEAKAVLKKVSESLQFDLQEVNVLEDDSLFQRYKEEIPVIQINGRTAFKFRVDEKVLVKQLRQLGR